MGGAHQQDQHSYGGRERDGVLPATDRFRKVSFKGPTQGDLVLGYDRLCWTGGHCSGRPYEGLSLDELQAGDRVALDYEIGCVMSAEATHCRSYRHRIDLPPMTKVAVDNHSGCAVDAAGAVWCFGDNEHGLLGDGSLVVDPEPAKVALDGVERLYALHTTVCMVAASEWHCAGNETSKPVRVGYAFGGVGGSQYELHAAEGTSLRKLSFGHGGDPTVVRGVSPEKDAIAGSSDRVGNLYVASPQRLRVAWSLGEAGREEAWDTFDLPRDFGAITALDAPASGICALSDRGRAACWYDTRFDHGGDFADAPSKRQALTPIDGPEHIVQIAAAQTGLCARTREGRVYCDGTTGLVARDAQGMVEIESLRGATHLDTLHQHLCAVVGGRVRCLGENGKGQLGRAPRNGAYNSRTLEPVEVDLPGVAVEVAVGQYHSCARLEDKTAWCWGSDEEGQLGRDRPVVLLDRAIQVRGSGAASTR